MRFGAENLRVGAEADFGAAPVRRLAGILQFGFRLAALECHPVKLLAARDFDLHALGQRIGDRDADAVQAAGGLIDLGVEFAASVQRAHDHFERRLILEFRMRIDRDAAAVVGDGDETVSLHLDLDPVGVAGQRLVHGVVDDFGEKVMQRLFVGAADIHAGTPAHRLEPFQDFDVLGGVAGLRRRTRALPRALRAAPPCRAGFLPALANRSGVFDDFAVFPTVSPRWSVRTRHARKAGESAAICRRLCHLGGKTMSALTAFGIGPYIARHERVFCDQFRCHAPPPSHLRNGTSARPRVSVCAAGSAAPFPVILHRGVGLIR